MAKKNPIAAAAKKMAAAPVSNNTVEAEAAVKAEAKAEAPKAEAKKAEEPKKETAKKTPAKRTTAKDIKTSVVVQFAGKEVAEKDLIAAVKMCIRDRIWWAERTSAGILRKPLTMRTRCLRSK